MKKSFIFSLLLSLCFSLSHAESVSENILSTPELLKTLQSGGHIIYMRHGPTNHNQKDTARNALDDCSKQRNLSVQGRELIKNIGQAIKALEIPIGDVLSSPYCRCKETASLVFGYFKIEPKLAFSISKNKEESAMLGEYLYTMISNSDAGKKNIVFVGHTSNLKDGLGIWPKPEGVVVVFKKQENQLVYQGMIAPDEWPGIGVIE